MNQPALPAYLQNLAVPNLSDRAFVGLGSVLPPHISIRGNRFTLVDSSGLEEPVNSVYLDVAIADIAEVVCKTYFEYEWEPGSKEPPTCFSANGIAPSREAVTPQSRTCAECPKNVRGSAVSKMSGAAIKACRDEKWLAVIVVGYPKDMIFRLVLTPGSFTNWRAYAERFRGQQVAVNHVICRLAFEAGVNGVLTFAIPQDVPTGGWLDERSAQLVVKAVSSKATDKYVGRDDVPRQLAAPPPTQATAAPAEAQPAGFSMPSPTGPFAQPQAPAASSAAFPSMQAAPQQTQTAPPAQAASPSSLPAGGQAPRRQRRTKAEMEAARAGQPAVGGQPPAPQLTTAPVTGGFTPAPFRPAEPPAASATGANGPAFGMSTGVAPNPELQATLASVLGK